MPDSVKKATVGHPPSMGRICREVTKGITGVVGEKVAADQVLLSCTG
jgi:hypothetical protein